MKTLSVNDLAERFVENPLFRTASRQGRHVTGHNNPAVFSFDRKTWLLLRTPAATVEREGNLDISEMVDPVHSQFILLCSDDGRTFHQDQNFPGILNAGVLESDGMRDCRVTEINDIFYLTYTMASSYGLGVGLMLTRDWRRFERKGMILPPQNRGCSIFEDKIRDRYYALHSPTGPVTGDNLWIVESQDSIHWGNHRCLATTRKNMWDSASIGPGCSPIRTPQGWLAIYNGTNTNGRSSLGALLLKANEPWRVIGRTDSPLMEPREAYETGASRGDRIFTNGHVVLGDKLRLYYSAGEETICGAELSISEILNALSAINE